jgi:hypothetical protein
MRSTHNEKGNRRAMRPHDVVDAYFFFYTTNIFAALNLEKLLWLFFVVLDSFFLDSTAPYGWCAIYSGGWSMYLVSLFGYLFSLFFFSFGGHSFVRFVQITARPHIHASCNFRDQCLILYPPMSWQKHYNNKWESFQDRRRTYLQ